MIQIIEVGEIIRINNKEYLIIESSIGNSDKKRPNLVLLNKCIKSVYRKPYFNKIERGLKENGLFNTSRYARSKRESRQMD